MGTVLEETGPSSSCTRSAAVWMQNYQLLNLLVVERVFPSSRMLPVIHLFVWRVEVTCARRTNCACCYLWWASGGCFCLHSLPQHEPASPGMKVLGWTSLKAWNLSIILHLRLLKYGHNDDHDNQSLIDSSAFINCLKIWNKTSSWDSVSSQSPSKIKTWLLFEAFWQRRVSVWIGECVFVRNVCVCLLLLRELNLFLAPLNQSPVKAG